MRVEKVKIFGAGEALISAPSFANGLKLVVNINNVRDAAYHLIGLARQGEFRFSDDNVIYRFGLAAHNKKLCQDVFITVLKSVTSIYPILKLRNMTIDWFDVDPLIRISDRINREWSQDECDRACERLYNERIPPENRLQNLIDDGIIGIRESKRKPKKVGPTFLSPEEMAKKPKTPSPKKRYLSDAEALANIGRLIREENARPKQPSFDFEGPEGTKKK